jgi:protein CpxP
MNKFLKHATRLSAVALCSAALCTLPAMAQGGGGRGMMTPEQRQAQFDAMATAVGLTPEQIPQVKAIQDDTMKKMADLRASGGDPQEMRPKMTAINAEQTTKIKVLLTDDQKAKYDTYLASRPQRGPGGGMGPGGPPPQQ